MAQKITLFLWYNDQATPAARLYVSIFKKSRITSESPMATEFKLDGQEFIAFNGGPFKEKFSQAMSLFVSCKTQKEVDYYSRRLTSGGGRLLKCGWLNDKYGVTWQIVPDVLGELLSDPNPEKAGRTLKAMLKMKKLDIAALKRAHAGRG